MTRHLFEAYIHNAHCVQYCFDLFQMHDFDLIIKRPRKTKFGDFRVDRIKKRYIITINNNLNQYNFLITYLHEVAHLVTYKKHKHKVKPHGAEWKQNFIHLAQPILSDVYLPNNVLTTFKNYLSNPKATSCSDAALYMALHQHNPSQEGSFLKNLPTNQLFIFKEKRYKVLHHKRTRALCVSLQNEKKYLISHLAEVVPLTD